MNQRASTYLLWSIYLALLAVLLPHTAWAFGQFEPAGWRWLGWVAAFSFEAAIAAFTWRLAGVIEATPRRGPAWLRFRRRYLNVYAAGLLVAVAVSSAANWAHSVEYGSRFAVFGRYGIPPIVYSVAFGGILPLCSLLFARILADVADTDGDQDQEALALRREVGDLRRALAASEARFTAAGDLLALATSEAKRDRILAARRQWPALPASAVAVIAGASPSYVSEVIGERGQ